MPKKTAKAAKAADGQARGARIREAINDSQLSQAEVGRRVGIGPTAMWKLCKGKTTPRGETLDKLAEVLSVSRAWILFGTPPKKARAKQDGEGASPTVLPGRHQGVERWIAGTPWGQKANGDEREWLRSLPWPDDIPEDAPDDVYLYALLSYRAYESARKQQ